MNEVIPKRTLQYRLAALVKSEILRVEGVGRKTKYYGNPILGNKKNDEVTQTSYKIPLS